MRKFRRRLRLRVSRLRRFGKLRVTLSILLFAAAVGFHFAIAVYLVNEQPDDSRLYVQLARNIVEQGMFSADFAPPFSPTLIRTPGYPLFLLSVYGVSGLGNEMAVRVSQALLFTLTCIFAAVVASQWVEDRNRKTMAAWSAFILAAFCPFTAIFSATILCETATMFFLAAMTLAATYAVKARKKGRSGIWWAVSGLLGGISVLFRPDAGLFAFGIGLALVISVFFGRGSFGKRLTDRFWKGIVFTALFALPLVPWTIRNEYLFGVFQPLAPTHAEMPGEFVPRGYLLWLRTWIDDSKYIDPLIWGLEQKPLLIDKVPPYAFSSEEERQRIAALFDTYNNSDPEHPAAPMKSAEEPDSDNNTDTDMSEADKSNNNDDADDKDDQADRDDEEADSNVELNLKISPEVDAAFAEIGSERVAREPWHYYVWLPAKRSTSMWFDTHSDFYPFGGELLPLTDLDNEKNQSIWLPLFAGLMFTYTIAAFAGALVLFLVRKGRSRLWLFMVLAISVPRIVFFGTIENPEPRYLVELFVPAAILGGILLAYVRLRREKGAISLELNYGRD